MCKLIKKTRRKSFTGYKIAFKKDGKYYSPATGIEYKIGDVPHCPRLKPLAVKLGIFDEDLLNSRYHLYEPGMQGKTSVLKYRAQAVKLQRACQKNSNVIGLFCLLIMTVSGEIWEGEFSFSYKDLDRPIFAGTHIDSMEEVV